MLSWLLVPHAHRPSYNNYVQIEFCLFKTDAARGVTWSPGSRFPGFRRTAMVGLLYAIYIERDGLRRCREDCDGRPIICYIYRERWPSSLSGGLRCMVGLERSTCPNSLSPSFGVFREIYMSFIVTFIWSFSLFVAFLDLGLQRISLVIVCLHSKTLSFMGIIEPCICMHASDIG